MNQDFDPHAGALARVRATRPEFAWRPGASADWAPAARARLRSALGGFDRPAVPLEAREKAADGQRGFTIREVDFCSGPGMRVFAYWLEPEQATGSTVVCVPGHGEGVDAIVGRADADYQDQFALQAVRAGHRVLAIEPASFGHRRSAIELERDSSCIRDAMAALVLGETLAGWRIRDAMAAVDYAIEVRGVDPGRIGIMGISGGGMVALWTAALDTRIRAAAISGYFNTFTDSILSIDHCVDNFVPGIATIMEMPDLAGLVAPRALFVGSGADDPIFPVQAFEAACRRAREIYGDDGAFEAHLFQGGHRFCGERAFPFLHRHL